MKRKRILRKNWGKALSCGTGEQEQVMLRWVLIILKKERVRKGMPVLELSEATHLTRQALNVLESGKGGLGIITFFLLCHAHNKAPSRLMKVMERMLGWRKQFGAGKWQKILPIKWP